MIRGFQRNLLTEVGLFSSSLSYAYKCLVSHAARLEEVAVTTYVPRKAGESIIYMNW
jgi:hypothetical protein